MAELFQNSNMLENTSQHIACNFDVSQELWNFPRGCTASQRVAGPYGDTLTNYHCKYVIVYFNRVDR